MKQSHLTNPHMTQTRTYKGCTIEPMGRNSWGGRWESYCCGEFIAADTLQGIKQMITDRQERAA